jgi:peptide/nickel transport system substrate-binding protein
MGYPNLTANESLYARARHRRNMIIAVAVLALTAGLVVIGNGSPSGASINTSGIINAVTEQAPTSLNPCDGNGGYDFPYINLLYAPLVYSVPSTGKLVPGIASSWAFSDGGLTLTMQIKSGLSFSDGTPLNAAAVVSSINTCLAGKIQSIPTMTSLTATGTDTVVFQFSAPTSSILGTLSSRIGLIYSPTAYTKYGSTYVGSNPVGAGPYQLSSYVPGTSVDLVPYKGYVQAGPPPADAAGINISIVSNDAAVVDALKSATANYAFGLDAPQLASIKGDSSLKYYLNSGALAMQFIAIDPKGPGKGSPMKNVDVRLALNYATNRVAMAKAATNGFANKPAYDDPYGGGADADTSKGNFYPYSVKMAKEYLKKAGYPHGITLSMLAIASPPFEQDAVIAQAQWAKAGIKLKITDGPGPAINSEFNTTNKADLYSIGWDGTVTAWSTYDLLFSPTSSFDGVHPTAVQPWLNKMNEAQTAAQLSADIKGADTVIEAQAPWVGLYFNPNGDAYATNVGGELQATSLSNEPNLDYLYVNG